MLEGGHETRHRGMMVNDVTGEGDLPALPIGPTAQDEIIGEIIFHSREFTDCIQTFGTNGHGRTERELHSLQSFGYDNSGHEFSRHAQSFQLRPDVSPADAAIESRHYAYLRRSELSCQGSKIIRCNRGIAVGGYQDRMARGFSHLMQAIHLGIHISRLPGIDEGYGNMRVTSSQTVDHIDS